MSAPKPLRPNHLLQQISDAIRSIRYGTVSIVVHDGRVIRIEKTEKIRLEEADQPIGGADKELPPPTRQLERGKPRTEGDHP